MWRVLKFIVTGAFCIGCVAALEVGLSLVGYSVIRSLIVKTPSAPDCMSEGLAVIIPIVISIAGAIAGAAVGAVAFGVAGVVGYQQPDTDSLIREVSKEASIGSLKGWVFGGALGAGSTAIWLGITRNAQVSVEAGLVWGLCIGFVLGVFGGAIKAIRQPT